MSEVNMENDQQIADRKWDRYVKEREKYGLTYTAQDAYLRGYDDGRSSKNINLQIAEWLMDLSAKHEDEPGTAHMAELAQAIRVFYVAMCDKGSEGRDAILRFHQRKREQQMKQEQRYAAAQAARSQEE